MKSREEQFKFGMDILERAEKELFSTFELAQILASLVDAWFYRNPKEQFKRVFRE